MERKFRTYLVTGASGYVGKTLVKKLVSMGKNVRCLILPNEKTAPDFPKEAEIIRGNVVDLASLSDFFSGDVSETCLVHCAGIVTIASLKDRLLRKVNITGTQNVMDMCLEKNISRVVHVSSVHAIPEEEKGKWISEVNNYSEAAVRGQYAKSKAAGTNIALHAASLGLDLSTVHPSGIIGPYSITGNVAAAIINFCKGKLPIAVKGGYDFVDVRDVADGIVACSEKGRKGEGYILSGEYVTLETIFGILKNFFKRKDPVYLPLWVVKMISPFTELSSLISKKPLFLTPYSAYTLGSNSLFSHKKATDELGYKPRSLNDTLRDMTEWLKSQKLV